MHGLLKGRFVNRWLWLCPALAVLLAAAVLMLFGLTVSSALLAALFLVCPALIVWGAVEVWREERRKRVGGRKPPRVQG
jgi:hypothetical protein